MEELKKLIEVLKSYQKQNLSLKAANIKLYKDEDIVLMELIKNLPDKESLTLAGLIEILEEKSPEKRYERAIDEFVKDMDQQAKNVHKL